jgi:signal transduction histidine kinase
MNRSPLPSLVNYALLILAIITLVLLSISLWLRVRLPYDGVQWSNETALVNEVDPKGPASGLLEKGDRVLEVDGRRSPVLDSLYAGKSPGDQVEFTIERDGSIRSVVVRLVDTPAGVLLIKLVPILISLAFWGIGVLVLSFQQSHIRGRLFYLVCILSGAVLASGSASSIGPPSINVIFNLSLWWLVPLVFHFHLHFPESNSSVLMRRLSLVLYALAAVASSSYLMWGPLAIGASSFVEVLYPARRGWMVAGFVLIIFLLAKSFSNQTSRRARREAGIVALGGISALLSFSIFTLIPELLLGRTILSYEFSFLFLLLIPISYGYAILRYRLIPLEGYANRGVATLLVYLLIAGLYLLLFSVIAKVLPTRWWNQPAVNLAIVLVTIAILPTLRYWATHFVNNLFYGGWYDYRSAITRVSRDLEEAPDPISIRRSLVDSVQAAMQLECACLVMVGEEKGLSGDDNSFRNCRANLAKDGHIKQNGPVHRCFQKDASIIQTSVLRREVQSLTLPKLESRLLACEKASLWLPLRGADAINGILILGSKRGGGTFTAMDREILNVVIRQASVALENADLVAELRQSNLERKRLNMQALSAGEKERKRLARELHDQVIQALAGLNYRLSEARRGLDGGSQDPLDRAQAELRTIVREIRNICADLRPPALDSMGLVAAIRSHLRTVKRRAALRLRFDVVGDAGHRNAQREVPEDVAMTLYRALQETLRNVEKHAQAAGVTVRLEFGAGSVALLVEDDGVGFEAPQRLSQYASEGHFGLMGLRERVELVGGEVHIATGSGGGCKIRVEVPLKPADPHSNLQPDEFRSPFESSATSEESRVNDDQSTDC